jgi:hypothetical protein
MGKPNPKPIPKPAAKPKKKPNKPDINPQDLLQETKDKLRITWSEEDKQIARMIETAISELNTQYGARFDFTKPGLAQTLMLEHVFYNRNQAMHEYRTAYGKELTELALQTAKEKRRGLRKETTDEIHDEPEPDEPEPEPDKPDEPDEP